MTYNVLMGTLNPINSTQSQSPRPIRFRTVAPYEKCTCLDKGVYKN